MAFTMAELRQELHALGYGALPDDFIVSSLSQLQLDVPPPQSWSNSVEKVGGSVSSSSRRVRFTEKSSRQVHGPPVPGDRAFALTSRKSTARKGGMDTVCFTPDFATELDEMRKMLKVMQGTKEELFGSGASTQRSIRKPMGLADEHEIYVGNLLDQWRVVGRSIRSKRKECLAVDVGALDNNNCNNRSEASSETGIQQKIEQKQQHASSGITESRTGHRQKQHEAFLDREVELPAEPSTSGELEIPCDGCDLQTEGVTVVEERNEANRSIEDELSSSSFMGTATVGVIANDSNEEALSEGCTNGLKSGREGPIGVIGIDTGPVFTRQESSSAISPGVSYQQGGMLYPENFTTDTYEQSELIMSGAIPLPSHQDADDNLLPSHEEAEDDPFSPSPRSSPAQLTKDQMLDKFSAMSKDQFQAAFQKSLDDLYPKDIIDQETFAHVNQKISDSINHAHVSVRHHIAQQLVESENPHDLGVPIVVRTPDRRGGDGGRRHQSPLNDRSNMRIAEDPMVGKTELHSAKALNRSSSVMLKRSRSSRVVSRRNEIVEGANDKHLLDIVEGGSQVGSHLLFENKTTTPPSSARKLKSERILGHSKSVAFPRRRNEIVEGANDTHPSDNVEGGSQVDSHLLFANKASTPPSSARKLISERILGHSKSVAFSRRRNEIVEGANDTHPSHNVEGGSQVDSHLLFENKASTPPSSRKLKSERILGHSKSVAFSRRKNEIVEGANDTHPSDNVEGGSQVGSHLLFENNTTTPPSSARKLNSERVYHLSKPAERSISDPRITYRHTRTGSALDGTDLEIPCFGLSPIKVREQPASALNQPSTRDRTCVANEFLEHRLGSHCSACSTVRNSSENNSQSTTSGSKSPFGKNLSETALSETEASPQQKRSVRKETGAGAGAGALSKQKVASNKSASAVPSGTNAPLVDPKKNDLNSNSKSLLKTRRLGSSMDFASDSSRLAERRTPSLRSSTESSRSSGPQRAPSAQSQVSKSNSVSPYAKSSFSSRSATPKDILSPPFGKTPSFTSYGSRSSATTKDTLTPGGPRRGGKVDRVARFAEMQNLWKNDKFLKTSSKRKPQSFHRIFARLHLSHERCTAAYRERVIEDMRTTSTEPPPFVVPTALYNNSEGVCTF